MVATRTQGEHITALEEGEDKAVRLAVAGLRGLILRDRAAGAEQKRSRR